mmetsp:Transcript_24902/g.94166  ORF Transcript_24902/g.94166 Transcript_24902/m.94166 type:complete len:270 (+) Transcript_24902:2322-3131(+)
MACRRQSSGLQRPGRWSLRPRLRLRPLPPPPGHQPFRPRIAPTPTRSARPRRRRRTPLPQRPQRQPSQPTCPHRMPGDRRCGQAGRRSWHGGRTGPRLAAAGAGPAQWQLPILPSRPRRQRGSRRREVGQAGRASRPLPPRCCQSRPRGQRATPSQPRPSGWARAAGRRERDPRRCPWPQSLRWPLPCLASLASRRGPVPEERAAARTMACQARRAGTRPRTGVSALRAPEPRRCKATPPTEEPCCREGSQLPQQPTLEQRAHPQQRPW